MIWIVLAALGIPLWLCATALLVIFLRNRALRARRGDVPVRRRPAGRKRWRRGHGVWVHDVFAFRGSPAMWDEYLTFVTKAETRPVASTPEARRLRRLGTGAVVCVMTGEDGTATEYAARAEHALELLGPFAAEALAKPRQAQA